MHWIVRLATVGFAMSVFPGFADSAPKSNAAKGPAVEFKVLDHPAVSLKYPVGWDIHSDTLKSTCANACSLRFHSPKGRAVADIIISRLPFNPAHKERTPECAVIRVSSVKEYLAEYDCDRPVPQGCDPPKVGPFGPRFPWGDSCGKFQDEASGSIGKMYIFEGSMWRDGLNYWRNKEVPMRERSVVYAITGVDDAVYKFDFLAEKSAFEDDLPMFIGLLDSFRLKSGSAR